MNKNDFNIESGSNDCIAMLEASTPYVYLRNAFRILGLPADVPIRDIKRRVDDLKHAEEIGDVEDEHTHAFALTTPPTLEHIRETAQLLQDPERRIIQEFYWFWPLEWGKGKADPALVALSNGDKNKAFNIWKQALIGNPEAIMLVSKHNLAVLYQLTALDEELANLHKKASEEVLKQIDKNWWASFKYWEEIMDEDYFWELVTERILSVGDPTLTAELSERMRSTLPKALHMINGQLALIYFENERLDLAGKHAEFMANTFQESDTDASRTFKLVTRPIQKRVQNAVEIARGIAERQPERAADAAADLFKAVAQPLEILNKYLSPTDHSRIDLFDAVIEAGLSCLQAFTRENKDWERCLSILEEAKANSMYASAEIRLRFAAQYASFKNAKYLDPISKICEEVTSASRNSPENAINHGNRLLTIAQPLIAALDAANTLEEVKSQARDEVAGTLAQCAIAYGNKTEEWKSSIGMLETARQLAVSAQMQEYIDRNLQISRQNVSFGDLKPIKSAPDLDYRYFIGFKLYGNTDYDASTKSYMSTYYFSLLHIPFIPLCRYRVIPIDNGYRFLGKASLRRFDKIHLAISLIVTVLFIVYAANSDSNSNSQSHPRPSSTPVNVSSPPPQPYDNRPTRASLRSEIENGKLRATEMESRIQEMDVRLQGYKSQLDYYRALDMVEEHNALLLTFNALVNKRNTLYERYSQQIEDINSKVRSYNAGSR